MPTATDALISTGAVALDVADLDVASAFYRRALGLTERGRDADGARLGSAARDLVVLRPAPPGARADHHAAGLFHLALLYPSRAELAAALLRLAAAGWRLDGASDHLVSEAVYLHDPEGNGIELYRDRERDEWPRAADGTLGMDTLPLDLRDLVAEAPDGGPAATAPEDLTMGHVHLRVADLEPTRRFYIEQLGFEPVVEHYPGALFVSTGGYHHHLGLNTWHSRGRRATPGTLGLRHAELRFADDGLRAAALERLRGDGVVPRDEVGGDPIVVDPSGNRLRLAVA